MAQRLVRRLCPDCRIGYDLSPEEIREFGINPASFHGIQRAYKPGTGECARCQGTHYLGRTGIHELLLVDEAVRKCILQRLDSSSIKAAATTQGFETLRIDGLRKVLEGVTSVEEVLLVTHEEV